MPEQRIELEAAINYCRAYRGQNSYSSVKGLFISKETLLEILNQHDAIDGVRVYIGIQDAENRLYIGCVSATIPGEGENIHDDFRIPLPGAELPPVDEQPIIGQARPCPIHCGRSNQINS